MFFITACFDESDDNKSSSNHSQQQPANINDAVPAATSQVLAEKLQLLDISEREYGDINAIALLFNQPIDPDQPFTKEITIVPELSNPVLSKNGKMLYFTGIEPRTDYSIEVSAQIKTVDGKSLTKAVTKKIKTRDLPAMASFEVDGAVMIPGKTEDLPILAINVPEVDIDIYKVKPDEIVYFLNEYKAATSGDEWYDETELGRKVKHVFSTRLKISTEPNKRNRAAFSVKKVPNIDQGGVYLATIRSPGGFGFQATWFTVSSIGIQARDYGEHTSLIAQNVDTGELLSGVEFTILDYDNKFIDQGVSDKKGSWDLENVWRKPNWKQGSPYLILASKDKQVTMLEYNAPDLDLSSFKVSGRPSYDVERLIFSPRDIYRPGEEVLINTIMRGIDGQLISGDVNLTLHKPNGAVVNNWLLNSVIPGYYEFNYKLDKKSPLGEWQARVSSPGVANTSYFSFKVEEFLPERLRIIFNKGDDELLSFSKGERILIPIKGEYLYGAPAQGNKLDTGVSIRDWTRNIFPQWKGFHFGEVGTVPRQEFNLDSVKLNSQGETKTKVDERNFSWDMYSSPARLRLKYSLFESGGRSVDRTYSILLWPRESFIGIKPMFDDNQSDINKEIEFRLIRANAKGEALAKGEAKATLYRIEEKYFWSYTRERGWHYATENNEYPVMTRQVEFNSSEPVALNMPVEWGKYKLILEDYSSNSKSIYSFRAGEYWYYSWNNASSQIQPDKITMALDKKSYKAGDTAQVKLVSPTDGKAIVLLETDQVLQTVSVELEQHEAVAEINIPKDLMRHDAYISAFVITPVEEKEKTSKRSFGVIHLPLNREDRKLSVAIKSPEKLAPKQSTTIDIEVTDNQGELVTGEVYVSLSAVDSGVLSITRYKQPDPFKYFYGRRGYKAIITDMYNNLIKPVLYDEAEVRWGGDGELEQGGEKPPADVKIVSLYKSPIKVENGKAQITLDLPDFDGELTIDAIAMGGEKLGHERVTAKVANSVVAQISMPRFMAYGDKSTFALDITNISGSAKKIKLKLHTSGAIATEQQDYQLDLNDGKKQIIEFDVDAIKTGSGIINASLELTDEQNQTKEVEHQWEIGVRYAAPAVYNRTTSVLINNEQITFPYKRLRQLDKSTIKAQLRVAGTPDMALEENFNALMNYKYGCLEQTTSKNQPLLVLAGNSAAGKNKKDSNSHTNFAMPAFMQDISSSEINSRVHSALSRYGELQLSNGGFGLWDKTSPEEYWLTAYATHFLYKLKKAGYSIPNRLYRRANERLSEYLVSNNLAQTNRWYAVPSHYELSYKAYAAYVLTLNGVSTLGKLRDLVEKQLPNSRGILPGVHLGLAIIESGSAKEGEKIVLQALDRTRASGYLGDYGSIIRDQAMAIALILDTDNASKRLTKAALELVPSLINELKKERWFSPQERAWLLKLAVELEKQKTSSWAGELVQAGKSTKLSAEGQYGINLALESLNNTYFINQSEQPVYASYSWTGLPKDTPKKLNEGIGIQVDWFKVKEGQASQLDKNQILNTGDTLLTRVRMYSKKQVPDALLVNLLPAGIELENQNLQDSLKLEDILIGDKEIRQDADIVYQEFKDDRYVAAVNLYSKREQTLYFVSRVVTPGTYKVPSALMESMYTPSIRGISNNIELIKVVK